MKNHFYANIWKYYLIKILTSLELTISIFILFFLLNNLTMTKIMILETIFIIVLLSLEVPSGVFADLFGRKKSLSISALAASISFLIFGLGSNFWIFLIAQIFSSISWAFFAGKDSALLFDSLKELKNEKEYAKKFGIGNFISMTTLAISSILSIFLATKLEYKTIFFITSFIFFIGFLITLTLKEPPIHKKIHKKNYIKNLKKALKFSFEHKIVKNLIIYYGLFAAVGHLSWFFIQPYYDLSYLPKFFIGIAIFLYFISAGIGHLIAEKFIYKINEQKFLVTILLIASLCFIGMYFFNAIIVLLLISIMSFTCGLRDVFVSKGINENTDSKHRATVMSVQSLSKNLMYGLLAPILGVATDMFKPETAFLIMGISLSLFFVAYIALILKSEKPCL